MADRNARLGTIIRLIARKPGITMSQLHEELSDAKVTITERTLAKDIALLKAEYKLLPDKDRLRNGYVLRGMFTLSDQEALLAMDAIHAFGNRLNDPQAEKMLERLSDLIREHPEMMPSNMVPTRTLRQHNIYKRSGQSRDLEQGLLNAIRMQKPVSIVYDTPRVGHPEESEGYPLLMVFHERGWYCIVRDIKHKSYHPRRVDRIKSMKLLVNGASNDSHAADVREAQFLMSCGWGMTFPRNHKDLQLSEEEPEIVVRFHSTMAPYILEAVNRHPRGKVVRLKDGTGDVEFRIQLLTANEFVFWVRSFGAKAWITAPQALIDKERAELRRMQSRYKM